MDINMIGICKAFGTNKVLGGVNLHIRPGEVHALMGENGAGKSTLMNILTGIHKADAGTILVDGKEVTFRNNKDAEGAWDRFHSSGAEYLAESVYPGESFPDESAENGFWLH